MNEIKNTKEKKVFQLWPISIYNENIGIDQDLIDHLPNIEFELMESCNGCFSKSKYILDTNEFKHLRQKITTCLNNYIYDYLKVDRKFKHYFLNSWVNKHIPGDWADAHMHKNSVVSGVYYLQTFQNAGGIVFHKPTGYTNNFHETLGFEYSEKTLYNTDSFTLKPSDGEILLFPSHIYHSVQKNNCNELRYSLAFNVFFEFENFSGNSPIDYLSLKASVKNEN